MRRHDDLLPRNRGLAPRQRRLVALEGFGDLGVGDVGLRDLALFTQLADGARDGLVALDLVRQKAAVFLRRAIARLAELRAELRVAREALADVLELLVDGAGDVRIRDFDLDILGLLEQQLLVHELVDDRLYDSAEGGAVRGHGDAALALLDDPLL